MLIWIESKWYNCYQFNSFKALVGYTQWLARRSLGKWLLTGMHVCDMVWYRYCFCVFTISPLRHHHTAEQVISYIIMQSSIECMHIHNRCIIQNCACNISNKALKILLPKKTCLNKNNNNEKNFSTRNNNNIIHGLMLLLFITVQL